MILFSSTVRRSRDCWRTVAQDCSGQDMIEYALLAAAVAVLAAAAIPTAVVPPISHLYSTICSTLHAA